MFVKRLRSPGGRLGEGLEEVEACATKEDSDDHTTPGDRVIHPTNQGNPVGDQVPGSHQFVAKTEQKEREPGTDEEGFDTGEVRHALPPQDGNGNNNRE